VEEEPGAREARLLLLFRRWRENAAAAARAATRKRLADGLVVKTWARRPPPFISPLSLYDWQQRARDTMLMPPPPPKRPRLAGVCFGVRGVEPPATASWDRAWGRAMAPPTPLMARAGAAASGANAGNLTHRADAVLHRVRAERDAMHELHEELDKLIRGL